MSPTAVVVERKAGAATSLEVPVAPRRGPRLGLWIFTVAVVALAASGVNIIAQVHAIGDEPWYLLQGYSIVHFHTVNLARVVSDPHIYRRFLGKIPNDHTFDFVGNGEQVLAYLPGYGAFVGALDALGGRLLIALTQSVVAACTAVLVYREGLRLFASRAVALFASAAYLVALPTVVYAGELFPTTLACFLIMAAFTLLCRLPTAPSLRDLPRLGALIALIAAVLPWLHVKYAAVSLAITATALVLLALRYRRERQDVAMRADLRALWGTVALVAGAAVLNGGAIALYSHHYFNTWYPQYRAGNLRAFYRVDLHRVLILYRQMFFDRAAGLLAWVPYTLLAPVGAIALFRRSRRAALVALALIVGLLSAFLSVAFAPYVDQAFAMPARFTTETLPLLALCVAALFALVWPSLRQALWALRREGVGGVRPGWRAGVALVCLASLALALWSTLAGEVSPGLLYPGHHALRLMQWNPNLVPGWWFGLFQA